MRYRAFLWSFVLADCAGGVQVNTLSTVVNTIPSAMLLPRLDCVTATGKGWRAICPACGGKSRKLSISESDNGTLLVHCFAGIGRSATVACAALIAEGTDPAAAIAQVRARRHPLCVESAAQRDALLDWGRRFGFR